MSDGYVIITTRRVQDQPSWAVWLLTILGYERTDLGGLWKFQGTD